MIGKVNVAYFIAFSGFIGQVDSKLSLRCGFSLLMSALTMFEDVKGPIKKSMQNSFSLFSIVK